MFKTVLTSFIHPDHKLCLLANEINWDSLEKEFAPLYGSTGRPSIPIRTIVGLLILKQTCLPAGRCITLVTKLLSRDILKTLTGSTFAGRFISNTSFLLIRVTLYIFASE